MQALLFSGHKYSYTNQWQVSINRNCITYSCQKGTIQTQCNQYQRYTLRFKYWRLLQ